MFDHICWRSDHVFIVGIQQGAMEMQILDVDYVLVNERPVIRLFGKDREGKSVCAFVEGFPPYFYAAEKPELDGVRVEDVKRKRIGSREPVTVYKVTGTNPAKTPELREQLQREGSEVFEADILFKYRFLNDKNLRGMGWVTIEGSEVRTQTVAVDRAVAVKSIEPLEEDKDVSLKTMAFDIECVSLQEGMPPEARRDPVIMISAAFSPPYKGQETMVLTTRPGAGTYCESEKAMLEEFISVVNGYDPDLLTGFNCNNFDVPYIIERMRQTEVRPVFGRCKTKSVVSKKLGARFKNMITGRVIVDSFEIVKKDFSLQRYGLDFVARSLLKKEKVDVKHSEIEQLWKGSGDEYSKLVEYARMDSILAMDLVQDLKLLDKYVALSRVAGTLLQDTLEGGETIRIENFLLREFNEQGYVFPSRPSQRFLSERDKIKKRELVGGYVIEPIKELHSNVVVLDFLSMYPSIIRTFNVCPTTLDKNGVHQSPSGARFLKAEERPGIIPHILERLMNDRGDVKKAMGQASDPEKKRVLYAKQWALKILANAFYGHLGYSRARIYDLDVANAITSWGRDIISRTAEKIEKHYGCQVVYGDTDSVFLKNDGEGMETIAKNAHLMAEEMSKDLPGIMTLEFEKVFKRFLPLSKKRYVAWSFTQTKSGWEEGMEMKGIETVRRDWCNLVGDTITDVIDILLKKDDVKGAVKHFRTIVNDLVGGKIPIQKLVITKTMTKSTKQYVGMQPHIELVKKIQVRSPGEAPGIGDRIPFVIVKGTDLLSKRAEDPAFVTDNGLEIDSQYYIENQLLPPLERIFSSLEVSRSELLGNGKQIGIMEALRKAPTPAKTVEAAEVKGYICEKCGSFYPHIPLLGVCKCGGRILFSGKKGRAERVVNN